MKKIVIFGSGGHARVAFSEIIRKKTYKFLGFVDEAKKKNELVLKYLGKNYYNLGSISKVIKNKNNFKGIIGVGLNFSRKKVYEEILKIDKNFKFEKIISKNAVIDSSVKIGDGTLIVSGSIINIGTKIGKHCYINTACVIEHDNIFKDFSSSGPRVVTGGNVIIGEHSYIGIGAIIKEKIEIQEDTIIGANSYDNKNCAKNLIFYGSPARKIKKRLFNENYFK